MEKVRITLTLDEAQNLYQLVRESNNTQDVEWNAKMDSILEKISEHI